jgi:hypothetical protein
MAPEHGSRANVAWPEPRLEVGVNVFAQRRRVGQAGAVKTIPTETVERLWGELNGLDLPRLKTIIDCLDQ